jgi:hypothetical protein
VAAGMAGNTGVFQKAQCSCGFHDFSSLSNLVSWHQKENAKTKNENAKLLPNYYGRSIEKAGELSPA